MKDPASTNRINKENHLSLSDLNAWPLSLDAKYNDYSDGLITLPRYKCIIALM